MAANIDRDITRELQTRKGKKFLLNDQQYRILRLRGMSQVAVERYESLLVNEIAERKQEPAFLPDAWVHFRTTMDRDPDAILHHECYRASI